MLAAGCISSSAPAEPTPTATLQYSPNLVLGPLQAEPQTLTIISFEMRRTELESVTNGKRIGVFGEIELQHLGHGTTIAFSSLTFVTPSFMDAKTPDALRNLLGSMSWTAGQIGGSASNVSWIIPLEVHQSDNDMTVGVAAVVTTSPHSVLLRASLPGNKTPFNYEVIPVSVGWRHGTASTLAPAEDGYTHRSSSSFDPAKSILALPGLRFNSTEEAPGWERREGNLSYAADCTESSLRFNDRARSKFVEQPLSTASDETFLTADPVFCDDRDLTFVNVVVRTTLILDVTSWFLTVALHDFIE